MFAYDPDGTPLRKRQRWGSAPSSTVSVAVAPDSSRTGRWHSWERNGSKLIGSVFAPHAGAHVAHGSAILVPKRIEDVATRVGLPVHEVIEVVDRLRAARLVLMAEDAGIEGDGFIVPEVGRLLEFLEFLNLKDRFGG